MIWNETKECMSRDELEFLQSKRLVKTVDRVYHNVEFYRKKKCSSLVLNQSDIKGIEDLHKLPLQQKKKNCGGYISFLDYLQFPRSEIVRIHTSLWYYWKGYSSRIY